MARRRELPDIEGVPVERGVGPARETRASAPSPQELPLPYEAAADGDLDDRERSDLATCEAAIDTLRIAFWAAGKALQVIRDARLYRGTHSTFDDYVEERWGIQRSYAHKLIRAWPLAERIDPIAPRTINEGQVRELLPVAVRHGDDAAVTVYETIATTEGVKVTASLIKGAVAVLPSDQFDRREAIERIRAYLAGQYSAPPAHAADDVAVFAAESTRLHTIAARVARHASDHPDQVREFADELRRLADQMEKQLS
jgi:hypothetical protein